VIVEFVDSQYLPERSKEMSELSVVVKEKSKDRSQWFEATVSIEGLRPTKLARKSDGCTKFTTRSAVSGAARRLAVSLGYDGVAQPTTVTKTTKRKTTRKAAKKRVRTA
jgi:hypothetical protein